MSADVIEFSGVSLAYGPQSFALREVTAGVAHGSFVALVGASGSGKTSLLKSVNRLVEPSAGVVRFDGRPVRDYAPHELRRRIGYVFQGLGLFPHMSVAENIAITPDLLGWPRARIDIRVAELLELVDLAPEIGRRAPAELSGGQRQRIALARALAAHPPVMLLDEPFGALDPATRDNLVAAYRDIHDDLRLTTIMVTHDMQEALLNADRILVLSQGRLVADGAPESFFRADLEPEAAALIDPPRRQAARIRALERKAGRDE